MPQTNFPNGFKYGVNLRGIPLTQTHPGQVFWLGNSTVLSPGARGASNGNDGTFNGPFATLDYAVGRCVANRGDVIFIKPGHAETISTAAIAALDVAGVAVIGLGSGSNRPTFTFTAAAANIPITAANMSIQNLLFVANFANVASFFTATGTAAPTDFTVESCEFRDTSSILNALTVITGNATANSMDGLAFVKNRISSLGTTAATTAIKFSAATRRVSITDNFGVWAILNDTAAMLAAGANNQLDFEFARNVLHRPNTSSTGGSFISGSGTWTGHCYDNYMWQLDNTAGIWIPTGLGLAFSQNFSPITGAADRSGLINPAAV
jgi:hypothetical protein